MKSHPNAKTTVSSLTVFLACGVLISSVTADGRTIEVGNFGPTGLEITVQPDMTIEVTGVQSGSPADDQFEKGHVITAINGRELSESGELWGVRKQLAGFITEAEAADGVLKFAVQAPADDPAGDEVETEVVINLPVLGEFSPTWPMDCPKTERIVRNNADAIAARGDELTDHNLYNGWAILMLLSTGDKQDLEVVRKIYEQRMETFEGADTGSHHWHNAYQGIAVCEYYLRTGDESVMPLINAICESARKYQVNGGWSHWAQGVNPQYVHGGLVNAAGTHLLTTLLLARQCGADVDEDALQTSLKFFYRFAGRGSNPYGDHRPEEGYGSNNGKSEMIAVAMNVAARAENGGVYAMARDKNAQTPLYSYPNMLQGHTGGMGVFWHAIGAALIREERPEMYRHRMDETQWFFELSRRHDGTFGASGAGRYDQQRFGYAVGVSLTAPRKNLQMTGAPPPQFAEPLVLPENPWGREADLAFFDLEGGDKYQGTTDTPPVELAKIAEADVDSLKSAAYHPEQVYRGQAAAGIRNNNAFGLIESLLDSADPRARQTACMAINHFNPWGLSRSKGVRSRDSIEPADFTSGMFASLMRMVSDPDEALWNVDHALLALAVASPEQIKSRLDDILPWLEHEEWWLNESTFFALSPIMGDTDEFERILPALVETIARIHRHDRPHATMSWVLQRATGRDAWRSSLTKQMANAFVEVYKRTPSTTNPEEGVDIIGLTSVPLERTFFIALAGPQETTMEVVRASIQRLDDMRDRELNRKVDHLIDRTVGDHNKPELEENAKRQIGEILVQHYRPRADANRREAIDKYLEELN